MKRTADKTARRTDRRDDRDDRRQSDVKETRRDLEGFSLLMRTGSLRKQLLSNRLEIRSSSDRAAFGLRMTLREAKALQRFLDETLGSDR